MLIPVRCFTCGKLLANLEQRYLQMIDSEQLSKEDALNRLGLNRYCCRTVMLGSFYKNESDSGHNTLLEKIQKHNTLQKDGVTKST
jgi:DNA-directed RNA polymerase subunit N (RpoN/RPB10)